MLFKKNKIMAFPESERKREIIGFLGKTGSGKSYKMKEYLSKLKTNRIFIWDSLEEYTDSDLKEHKISGFKFVDDIKEFVNLVFNYIDKNDYSKDLKIVFSPLVDSLEIDPFCEAVYSLGKSVIAIEEADLLFPERGVKSKALLELIKRGRHRAVSIVWTTQRPAEVGKTLLAMSNQIYAFQITESNDLKYLAFLNREKVLQLPNLEYGKYEYVILP